MKDQSIKSGDFAIGVNEKIDELFIAHETAIDALVNTFNAKHDAEPDKYPLLPLSNNVKNSMFPGYFPTTKGGKNRKGKKSRKNRKSKRQNIHSNN